MVSAIYKYMWGNNPKRKKMKGRLCKVICFSGSMGSALVEFLDTGERVNTSRRALKRVEEKP